ncbi:helix-turn-helix domain-containing protein [Streptomyces specialis]|uniref:helix-turn-helix domain-containing protein n=1 Tax=Streptomyces specialis TaxID=498367 RepID=UPI00073F75D4|nr:helix-turn-helix transcriptional regulator [Streptomyces specialis]
MNADFEQAGRDRTDLANALRTLRLASGLSGERLAVRCGMSQSKISRMESGRALPSVVDVQLIVGALDLDNETAAELLALTRRTNAEYESIRASVRRGLHHRQRELASLEARATCLRYFLPAIPTGLLQTAEYMRAAMSHPMHPARGDVSRTIQLKLERQAVLHDRAKRFDFVLTESAARWRLCGSDVMALQLDRLVSLSLLPSVRISVLPLSRTTPDIPFNTFTLYDRDLATLEVSSGRIVLRDPKDIDYYNSLFDFFQQHAVSGSAARELLEGWADEFRAEAGGG